MRTVLNSSVDPLLGRLLDGRYEVSGRIAQGGMAVVYSAFDTRLDRTVAVKVMHPALAADEDFVARFRREAKAAAKLSSPHVVSVTDQGRDGDVIFLVMELVEGRTLREVLREAGRLSAPEALEIMIPVLEALAAAHRAGLIHRDVKPENVLVADDGMVKVGDFGLARAVEASPLTATTGLLLGTVAYLAPEQVARGVADARADIYACGIMLFELLTGKPPYQGPTPLQVAYQHLNEDVPPPSSVVPNIPKAVDRLVTDTTSRDPAGRPHDATAMLFRTRAILDRIDPDGSARGLSLEHNATAPLEIDLDTAEAAALELVRRRQTGGRPATPASPAAFSRSFVDGMDGIPDIAFGSGSPFPASSASKSPAISAASSQANTADPFFDEDHHDLEEGQQPAESFLSRRKSRKQTARDAKFEKQRARKRRFLRPGRVALILLVVLSVAAGLIGWQLAGRRTTVPTVIGNSPAAAQAALRAAHLKPRLVAVEVYSETVPKGQVGATDPAPGKRVSRGSVVSVELSLGPERYTVPTVTNLQLSDAVSALRVAHLHPDTPTEVYSDTVAVGSVVSITPAAGSVVKPSTPVAIKVSKGPQPVTAPKITDLTGDAAKAALEKAGLKVTVAQAFSSTVNFGMAIGITPATGLHRTQSVKLTVSKGPQMVYIPSNIEDYSPSNAESYLTGLGLNVGIFSVPGLDSRILRVKPDAGSSVPIGSSVTIYLY
jgi:serine/threonine protein kinase/beta-lactam-binding protein with PASTA domain